MRLIGVLHNQNDARRFSKYLKKQGIDATCEASLEVETDQITYQCWVHDEDQIEKALADFLKFKEHPSDPVFDEVIEDVVEEKKEDFPQKVAPMRKIATPFTSFIIALCSVIFILNLLQEYSLLREGFSAKGLLMTPIEAELLFDLPQAVSELEKVIGKYQISSDQKIDALPAEIQAEIEGLKHIPFWRGIYDWVLLKFKGKDTTFAEGPLFSRIRQGEIWRLFSPAVLHRDFLHILFNMAWVWILCRPIEQRIGVFRLTVLTLVVGILSNVLQYLASGPFFLGYSGVVMGLAAFTWMRERIAPWEGYPLQRSVIFFLVVFVAGMFLLQLGSFFFQVFTSSTFEPNIANTAHIGGALIGAMLARLSFFKEKVRL